jgi:PPK2 family polyphosphate:nucleotide phosphotransferase
VDRLKRMVEQVRVEPRAKARLGHRRPDDRLGEEDRAAAEALATEVAGRVGVLTAKLGASAAKGLLVVLQGMDASGKDGTIRHCFDFIHPGILHVWSFKVPTPEELAHDFLWRIHAKAPRRGEVAIFNRSHYEDVLVVRVDELVPRERWEPRYDAINAFERNLVNEGTVVVKLFLHISREEQAERFQERIEDESKNWKFDEADLRKRDQWDAYQDAYADAIERTSTEWAPWYVIPGDRPWLRNLVVAAVLEQALAGLGLEWPQVDPAVRTLRIT